MLNALAHAAAKDPKTSSVALPPQHGMPMPFNPYLPQQHAFPAGGAGGFMPPNPLMYQLMMQQQQASMMQATFDNNQYIPGAMTGAMTGQLAVYPKTDVKPETVSLGYNQSQSLGGGLEKMPCRARGVPADHTFQTAYFIVKKGTPVSACQKGWTNMCGTSDADCV